jgi:hypothetical protein
MGFGQPEKNTKVLVEDEKELEQDFEDLQPMVSMNKLKSEIEIIMEETVRVMEDFPTTATDCYKQYFAQLRGQSRKLALIFGDDVSTLHEQIAIMTDDASTTANLVAKLESEKAEAALIYQQAQSHHLRWKANSLEEMRRRDEMTRKEIEEAKSKQLGAEKDCASRLESQQLNFEHVKADLMAAAKKVSNPIRS